MSEWIEPINAFAFTWKEAMYRATWQGAIGLSMVWVVCRIFTKLPGRIRCWLWRAAYLKLLIALVWATPINLPLLHAKPVEPVVATSPVDHFPSVQSRNEDRAEVRLPTNHDVAAPITPPAIEMAVLPTSTRRVSVASDLLG